MHIAHCTVRNRQTFHFTSGSEKLFKKPFWFFSTAAEQLLILGGGGLDFEYKDGAASVRTGLDRKEGREGIRIPSYLFTVEPSS